MKRLHQDDSAKSGETINVVPIGHATKNPIHQVLSLKEAYLVSDNRIFNGPLCRSLCLFAHTAHSAHLLCFATLALLTRYVHRLAHSLRSLPRGTFEIHKYLFTLHGKKHVFGGH